MRPYLRTALAAALLVGRTIAQDQAPLAGPEVQPGETRSLVNESMTAGFVRLENRPEIAVIELLDLDEQAAGRARRLAEDRTVRLTTLLVDEIDTLRRITDHTTAGDSTAAHNEMLELWDALDPSRSLTPLL
ncbi:MAG: hypothetical protein AAGB48_10875, partial [Planctomycetota bacterium]